MGTRLHPLRDALPISRTTKKSLKKQMTRFLRRHAKRHPDQVMRTRRHKGWFW